MAVIGEGGALRLQRTQADPETVTVMDVNPGTGTVALDAASIWTGDLVRLQAPNGLPFDLLASPEDCGAGIPRPANPGGHGIYRGSRWELGRNRRHLRRAGTGFYARRGDERFYVSAAQKVTEAAFWVHKDHMDRLSFYRTRSAALRGEPEERLPIYSVAFGAMALQSVVDPEDWTVQADLGSWRLTLVASEVDTTSLGERFGDAVKDIISGGGSLDFLVDRREYDEAADVTRLLNLLLMVEKGCEGWARFYVIQDRPGRPDDPRLPGSLYYECRILLTGQVVNTKADEIVAGSCDFVTVKQIGLRMGSQSS